MAPVDTKAREAASRELDVHHDEMAFSYLRFANMQRAQQLKELLQNFDYFKESRLGGDENLTPEEVVVLFDGLYEALKSDAFQNLQRISRSTVILLRQLFGQAEDARFLLEVDTSALEDDIQLKVAEKMEEECDKKTIRKMLLKVAEKMEEECDKKHEPRAALPEAVGKPKMKLVSLESRKEADSLLVESAQLKLDLAEKDKEDIAEKDEELEQAAREKAALQTQLEEALAQAAAAAQGGSSPAKSPGDEKTPNALRARRMG
ncbi:hypothetical protein T484DRAFT_1885494, partial [Baffinella frigidus]